MRGKEEEKKIKISGSRITPAYAGKSCFLNLIITCNKDHPRLCGEKSHIITFAFLSIGSPPPMRGKD